MYKIIEKEKLTESAFKLVVEAKLIAQAALPGQFIILMVEEKGERIPLTICDYDKDKGYIQLVVDRIGVTTSKLEKLEPGDSLYALTGPLGRPSDFVNWDEKDLASKRILLAGGGVGTAPLLTQAKWLNSKGVDFDVVLGFRDKSLVILEEDFKKLTDGVIVTTDDGSYGLAGFVNDGIKEFVCKRNKKYDLCYIAGPLIMMKFTSMTSLELGIPSMVSMNPVMVDGTGMCGACRLSVGGKTKFACVDGPEFDASLVDFDEVLARQDQYMDMETKEKHEYCELTRGCAND